MSDLAKLLVLARELKGWSQRELALRSGVGHVVIAQIETGKIRSPGFAKMVAVADALDLPVERFAVAVRPYGEPICCGAEPTHLAPETQARAPIGEQS